MEKERVQSPTIDDVAKKANVSKSTVSRVLNNSGYASDKTKKLVLKTCLDLNFIANRSASSLKGKKTNIIALIIPDILNPFFTVLAKGVEEEVKKNGYDLILTISDGKLDNELRAMRMYHEGLVDGIICSTNNGNVAEFQTRSASIPMVMLIDQEMEHDMIYVDNVKGGYIGTKYLIEEGHQSIAHIGGFHERIEGYQRALKESHMTYDPSLVIGENEMSYKPDEDDIEYLLHHEARPTAIFAKNDFIATECWLILERLGYSVPEDISILGFDNMLYSEYFRSGLSTVAQPGDQRGRMAASMLIERMEGKVSGKARTVVLEPELVIRNSVKTQT